MNTDTKGVNYAARLHMFDFLHAPAPVVTEHEESGRFIPLSRISSKKDLKDFAVDVVPLLHMDSEDSAHAVRYCLEELIRVLVPSWWQTPRISPDRSLESGIPGAQNGINAHQTPAAGPRRAPSKTVVLVTAPGVRILPSPLQKATNGSPEPGPSGRVLASLGRVRGQVGGKLGSTLANSAAGERDVTDTNAVDNRPA